MAESLSFVRSGGSGVPVAEEGQGVLYLRFPALSADGLTGNAFSTRLGGVSSGCFSTMNLSFTRGDDPEDVRKNYRIMSEALGIDLGRAVLSHQTHTTNVVRVTASDAGRGVSRDKGWTDVDGLITDEPGIPLVTFYADCVPLYFVDPVHRAIGLSHSGWRGTVNRMGAVTVRRMAEEFGTDPADLRCAIGPCICGECYEVGPEVAEEFYKEFPGHGDEILKTKPNGKYLLDLRAANRIVLIEAGVSDEKLEVTEICTRCNPELLFSHRIMGNQRGNNTAILWLNERR